MFDLRRYDSDKIGGAVLVAVGVVATGGTSVVLATERDAVAVLVAGAGVGMAVSGFYAYRGGAHSLPIRTVWSVVFVAAGVLTAPQLVVVLLVPGVGVVTVLLALAVAALVWTTALDVHDSVAAQSAE